MVNSSSQPTDGAEVTVSVGAKSIPLHPGASLSVGRDPACDIHVSDERSSRRHLTISRDGLGRVLIVDQQSRNGTYTAGQRITSLSLERTTELSVGAVDGSTVHVTFAPPTPTCAAEAPEPYPWPSERLTVGRDDGNAIALDDPLVSRRHAVFERRDDGFLVTDLNSRNGVQINGVTVRTGLLREGDAATIGRTVFQVAHGRLVHETPSDLSLVAEELTFALPGGRTLLQGVSFRVQPSKLIAVIGPSGAGKSTLLRALTGSQPATSGRVLYNGSDLYENYASLQQRIGVVPQDDVVHRQLTVDQALGYAAELRLPADYTAAGRRAEVERVLGELGLKEHAGTQISRLSGGQRKRVSVALELLTQPNLLLLDEPTSGLDPNLDRSIMTLLRNQADGGRTVVVITHSVANLGLCDEVLILAPGGRVAYFGPPSGITDYFGGSDYADVFERVVTSPDRYVERFARSVSASSRGPLGPMAPRSHALAPAPSQPPEKQWSTLIRRQARIILADRSYAVASVVLPLVIALMAWTIPGSGGFGPSIGHPGEASQLLVVMIVGAGFMGMSATIRELVGERPIFLRERAVGLSPTIYLAAKLCVLVVLGLVQSLLLVGMIRLRKPGPEGAVLLGSGTLELILAAFLTAVASGSIGLLFSAFVGTGEQAMPVLVITVMYQLVMCGGLIQVSGRGLMEVIASLAPARWGYAQGASVVDLQGLNPLMPKDWLYNHQLLSSSVCLLAQVALVALAAGGAARRLARQRSAA